MGHEKKIVFDTDGRVDAWNSLQFLCGGNGKIDAFFSRSESGGSMPCCEGAINRGIMCLEEEKWGIAKT